MMERVAYGQGSRGPCGVLRLHSDEGAVVFGIPLRFVGPQLGIKPESFYLPTSNNYRCTKSVTMELSQLLYLRLLVDPSNARSVQKTRLHLHTC